MTYGCCDIAQMFYTMRLQPEISLKLESSFDFNLTSATYDRSFYSLHVSHSSTG